MLHFVRPGREIETQAARAFGIPPHRPKPDVCPESVVAAHAAEWIGANRHLAQLTEVLPPRQAKRTTAARRSGHRGIGHAGHTARIWLVRGWLATYASR